MTSRRARLLEHLQRDPSSASMGATAAMHLALPTLSLLLLLICGGCGVSSVSVPASPPVVPPSSYSGVPFTGKVLAGTKPVSGASVQLFTAGVSGNGSAPTNLGPAVVADPSGAFSVAGGYTCPSSSSQLYIVASGGVPAGSASSASNTGLTFLAPLGACGKIAIATSFRVNEATTAASVWALAQFLSEGGKLGASASNAAGLANAVATALSLTDNTNGSSPGPTFPANAVSPASRVNTLANALNACAISNSACSSLFSLATPSGKMMPTNTLDAALNLVRNPALNVAAIFTLSQSSKAFSPALASAPADWTLSVNLSGGGLHGPAGIAVDGNGNVWVAGYFGVASEFSTIGAPLFPSGITGSGIMDSYGLAIDASDNVWIANESSPSSVNTGVGSVTVLNSAGQPISGATGYTAGGINYPLAIAVDPNGVNWVLDYGNAHLTQLSSSGQALSGTAGYTSALLSFPIAIALDANHNAWIANQAADKESSYNITKVSADGKQFTNYSCCNAPSGIAIDQLGNVWAANLYGNSVSEISSTGSVLSSGAYTGGGLNYPQGIAIDGSGGVWVSNFRGNSITQLAGAAAAVPGKAISPPAGWAPDSALLQQFALAVDASGNLWVSNFGNNTITKVVGIATPVKTPLLGPPQLP